MKLLVLLAVLLLVGCEKDLDKPTTKYRKVMQVVTIIGSADAVTRGPGFRYVRYVVSGYEEIVETTSTQNSCSEHKLLTPGTVIDIPMYEYLDDNGQVTRLRAITDLCQLALTGKIRPKINEPINTESP